MASTAISTQKSTGPIESWNNLKKRMGNSFQIPLKKSVSLFFVSRFGEIKQSNMCIIKQNKCLIIQKNVYDHTIIQKNTSSGSSLMMFSYGIKKCKRRFETWWKEVKKHKQFSPGILRPVTYYLREGKEKTTRESSSNLLRTEDRWLNGLVVHGLNLLLFKGWWHFLRTLDLTEWKARTCLTFMDCILLSGNPTNSCQLMWTARSAVQGSSLMKFAQMLPQTVLKTLYS